MATQAEKSQIDQSELEVSELADSLEALLKSYGDDAKDGLEEAQKNAEKLLKKARATLNDGQETLKDKFYQSGCSADSWVRDNPLPAAGIGAALGVVFGLLLARR